MVEDVGFEPTTPCLQGRCSPAELIPQMAVPGGIEPPSLAWQASVITTGPWNHLAARAGFEPTNVRVKVWCVTISPSGNIGADRGNRTLVNSLEGYSSTIKLHLHKAGIYWGITPPSHKLWGHVPHTCFSPKMDSVSLITYTNHRIVNPCRFLSILTAIAGGHVSHCSKSMLVGHPPVLTGSIVRLLIVSSTPFSLSLRGGRAFTVGPQTSEGTY